MTSLCSFISQYKSNSRINLSLLSRSPVNIVGGFPLSLFAAIGATTVACGAGAGTANLLGPNATVGSCGGGSGCGRSGGNVGGECPVITAALIACCCAG